ncbi:putative leucine-rich repeat-containing protein DDB_G0290503 isoform X2 [Bicyclus anynana]|uniref:Leucine-rich repeat-containing protein DDB_G0290503 isoform X2 n=1 Tax=Bicyclus anynana TaxID=110368 RepID=A0ABM3LJ64_BICAN|nr:putative leucine-rich repeat-containing protein DDB_G0290503 isoform X2 [Bicyclus anynana]
MYYTQIILLLFALQSLVSIAAYTLVQVQDNTKQKLQESLTEVAETKRPFTNGHGYQFDNRELIEHQKSTGDEMKAENTDTDVGGDERDNFADNARDETNRHNDNEELAVTARPFTNGHGYEFADWDPIDVQPTDKIRRKRQLVNYQNIPDGLAQHNLDPQVIPDHVNRMLVSRPSIDNSMRANGPLRDEYGNVLYENMNPVYSGGRQFANVPRGYGNLRSDQGYVWNQINNIQNEPLQNQYISQAVQQRPLESSPLNCNPYKQIQLTTPDNELKNIKQTPIDRNDDRNMEKLLNSELTNKVNNESFTQVVDKQIVTNNSEVIKNVYKEEMMNNVNQISKRINSIKDKVKDKFGNINGILNSTAVKKLLVSDKNVDIADKQLEDYTQPNSDKLTDDKLDAEPSDAIIDVDDANINGTRNITDKGAITNVIENNEEIEKPEQSICNLNNNEAEPFVNNNQTAEDNISVKTEAQTTEINDSRNSTPNETINNEQETLELDPIESILPNETSSTDIKQDTLTEVVKETDIKTSDIKVLNEANIEVEENSNDHNNHDDIKQEKSTDLNFEELFDKEEFWDWLSKWTTAYMEILNENIKTIVKGEVTKQLVEIKSKTSIDGDLQTMIDKKEDLSIKKK